MIELGKTNSLRIARIDESGVVLDGDELGELFLPKKELPGRYRINDYADVFIYIDSKDQVVVTAREPYARAGELALLKAVSSNSYGAFLDWGLEHDLRVSQKEQQKRMRQGQSYMVYVYNDKNNRIAASTRFSRFFSKIPEGFREGQRVDLVIGEITAMGYRAIINRTYPGVLYRNEVFRLLKIGQEIKGYIKKIREDGKIDLALQKSSAREKDELSGKILDVLKENGGSLDISDKTTPERIYKLFGVSKKRYKNAIGALYKRRLIMVKDNEIRLVHEQTKKPSGALSGRGGTGSRRIRSGSNFKR